jgi:hypothetical protein
MEESKSTFHDLMVVALQDEVHLKAEIYHELYISHDVWSYDHLDVKR